MEDAMEDNKYRICAELAQGIFLIVLDIVLQNCCRPAAEIMQTYCCPAAEEL